MILKAPIKALDLKKGDELPVRVVMGDSVLLITSEYKVYDYDVMRWVKQRDTTAVPYAAIKSMRYDRTGRVRWEFGTVGLLGGKELFHFLTIKYILPDEPIKAVVLRLDKDEQRDLRDALEERSHQKIEVRTEDVK